MTKLPQVQSPGLAYSLTVMRLEEDILLLEVLLEDVEYFIEEVRRVENTAPAEEVASAEEDFQFALKEYEAHKAILLSQLDFWIESTMRANYPVDINYYRILSELREIKKRGL